MKQKGTVVRLLLSIVLVAMTGMSVSANGLNLNGSGSRAMGMGGAVIAWTNDVSLFYFNPAGAANAEGTWISLFETNLLPSGTYTLAAYGIDAKTKSKIYPAGALGFIKPLSDKLTIGLGVYTPSGTGATWDGEQLKALSKLTAYEWESFLGVVTVSPLVAYKVSDKLALGATINLNYGMMNIKRPGVGQYEESLHGIGFGATFGMQFKPSDKLAFGLSYKLPVSVTLKGDATMSGAASVGAATESDITRKTTLPMWLGAGVSFKPMDKLRLAFDVNWTNWKKLDKIPVEFSDAKWTQYMSVPALKPAFDQNLDLKWTDCIQVRVGAEYMFCESWAVRLGYMRDPSPAPLETMNILLPQIPYNMFTVGAGYTGAKLSVNAALEILRGAEQTVPLSATAKMPGVHNMNIIVPSITLAYRFN
ncbi:MAG: outer membrane protein transport protein [Acidobacteria bacterium]|jgi:long-chain fatty acid transport protein|nr:outer membrane protein transport protein [Acidobacteriota bacterium]